MLPIRSRKQASRLIRTASPSGKFRARADPVPAPFPVIFNYSFGSTSDTTVGAVYDRAHVHLDARSQDQTRPICKCVIASHSEQTWILKRQWSWRPTFSERRFPALVKAGWPRRQEDVAKPPKWSRRGGWFNYRFIGGLDEPPRLRPLRRLRAFF